MGLKAESWRPVADSLEVESGKVSRSSLQKRWDHIEVEDSGLRFMRCKRRREDEDSQPGGKVGHLIILCRNLLGKILLFQEVIYYNQYTDDTVVFHN